MPVLLGFILGVAVTILGVYEYDSSTGRAGNGLSAGAAGGNPFPDGGGAAGVEDFTGVNVGDLRRH